MTNSNGQVTCTGGFDWVTARLFFLLTCFLVTGKAGFIGSNLCEALLDMSQNVRCMDDLSNGFMAIDELFTDNPRYNFMKGDIRDMDVCLAACDGADYVLHQAAWGRLQTGFTVSSNHGKPCKFLNWTTP